MRWDRTKIGRDNCSKLRSSFVAHGTQEDPILSYGNRAALDLWETDLETLLPDAVPENG